MITNGQTLIGLTATPLDGVYNQHSRLTIHNNDNTDALFIGGPAATITNGLVLQKEQTLQLVLGPLEQVYAVSSKAGHSISWMRQTI